MMVLLAVTLHTGMGS